MRLGSSVQRDRQRRRRRALLVLAKWLFFLGLIGVAAGYAWVTATKVALREAADLKTTNQVLMEKVAAAETELREGVAREAVLSAQLPSAAEVALIETARRRVADGVSITRLTEIVAAATPKRQCDNTPTTKRFRVRTPITSDEGTAASFAGNAITVRAEGRPAVNADGAPEAWFDSAQPITVSLLHLNGATGRAEGMLPLQYALAVGKDEFRFQIQEGGRGLIVVTMDRCDYP